MQVSFPEFQNNSVLNLNRTGHVPYLPTISKDTWRVGDTSSLSFEVIHRETVKVSTESAQLVTVSSWDTELGIAVTIPHQL